MTEPSPAVPAPPPAEPWFQVQPRTHIGALILWINQSRVVSGSYAQCEAALREAQVQNLILGWWSFLSIILNPLTLLANSNARRALRRQADQAHDYAVWWATHYGGGVHNYPVWTPPWRQQA